MLAQSARGDGLPRNVDVRVFGSSARAGRGLRFERELARSLPAGAVVAHMIPLYVLLAAPLVRPRRIPLLLWYTHWHATWKLRAAERLATAVVSVDRRSFPLDSAKVRPIGHGIDVSEFPCSERATGDGLRVLVLGRYSPAKGLPTVFDAVSHVEEATLEVHGAALSDLERAHRREPELFARSDVLVNNMRAGAPDKVVYEAAAACLPVLASNPVFDELFGEYPLLFDRDDPASLADRLRWVASLSPDRRSEIGRALRERVAERHSVETWADGVLAAAR